MKRGGLELLTHYFWGEAPCEDISLVSPYMGGLLDEEGFGLVASENEVLVNYM